MAIFAVIRQNDDSRLNEVVASAYPRANYALSEFSWLVAASGTAIEVAESLGLAAAGPNTGIVLEVGSYYGRTNPAIWTWIKTNWEASSG